MQYLAQILIMLVLLTGSAHSMAQCGDPVPKLCDADGDFDVDSNDIAVIGGLKGSPSSGPGDLRDVDGDGMITVLDARQCVAKCSKPNCSQGSEGNTLIAIEVDEQEASTYGPNLAGLRVEDSRGNEIKIFLTDDLIFDDVLVKENVDLGDIPYTFVTSKFIKIELPEGTSERQLVVISPSDTFDFVYQISLNSREMIRLPFVLQDDGTVKIRPEPVDSSIYIALVSI